jgi:hypothetical protein
MNFRLLKKTSTKANTVFQVIDNVGAIRGSITVPLGAEDDLLRHWAGPTGNPPAAKQGKAKALLRSRRHVSKAAILRGSGLS